MNVNEKKLDKIAILTVDQVKLVNKPWGWEKWIAEGAPKFPYALKEIFIKAPHKSSIQVHRDKQETNFIQKGKGILHYSDIPIDVDKYDRGDYSQDEINEYIKGLKQRELLPGVVFHIIPGFIHSVEAVADLTMVETSTVELDDVFRLKDDAQRGHGKIESEHV